jgi:hypothetical protein
MTKFSRASFMFLSHGGRTMGRQARAVATEAGRSNL